jgi:UPF0271 protein
VKSVDLNSDVGEWNSTKKLRVEECILKYVTSANIACGFHAGDPHKIMKTIRYCERHGVGVGAHPSFNDRANFGRRVIDIGKIELTSDVAYQLGGFVAVCTLLGTGLSHIKAHGALYNIAWTDERYAFAFVSAAKLFGVTVLAPYNSQMMKVAESMGLRVVTEAFADRNYSDEGRLLPRSRADSLITDPGRAAERALRLVDEGVIRSVSGKKLTIRAQSLCIHSDTPNSCQIARAVRKRLEEAGVKVVRMSDVGT